MRVLFLFWGRRGAMSQHLLDIGAAARDLPGLEVHLSVSTGCEQFKEIVATGLPLFAVDTFSGPLSLIGRTLMLPGLRRRLARYIRDNRIDRVVVTMSHVWGPLVASAVRDAGATLTVVVHDAEGHPGDPTGVVARWLLLEARQADLVVTWSRHVAERLAATTPIPRARIRPLFHPLLNYAADGPADAARGAGPCQFLFFGRLLAYKGLAVLAAAAEMLRAWGVPFRLAVVGDGDLGPLAERLAAAGAEVENRWVASGEIAGLLARHDALVLPYLEASQSGVVPAAWAVGCPVVASRVSGLAEQVTDGVNGLLVPPGDADALARAMRRLCEDADLRRQLADGVAATRDSLSVRSYLRALLDL